MAVGVTRLFWRLNGVEVMHGISVQKRWDYAAAVRARRGKSWLLHVCVFFPPLHFTSRQLPGPAAEVNDIQQTNEGWLDKYRESVGKTQPQLGAQSLSSSCSSRCPPWPIYFTENNSVSSWFTICLPLIANNCLLLPSTEGEEVWTFFSTDEQRNNKIGRWRDWSQFEFLPFQNAINVAKCSLYDCNCGKINFVHSLGLET